MRRVSQARLYPDTVLGGELIAAGSPEEVAEVEESFTGQYLREVLPEKAAAAA